MKKLIPGSTHVMYLSYVTGVVILPTIPNHIKMYSTERYSSMGVILFLHAIIPGEVHGYSTFPGRSCYSVCNRKPNKLIANVCIYI